MVRLTGNGLGGRNQELALAAAPGIAGIAGGAVFSVGSDGTDGPTDAAGGDVGGDSYAAPYRKMQLGRGERFTLVPTGGCLGTEDPPQFECAVCVTVYHG